MAFLSSGCAGGVGEFSGASGNVSGSSGFSGGLLILDKERTRISWGNVLKLEMVSMKYDRMMMCGNFLNKNLFPRIKLPISTYRTS